MESKRADLPPCGKATVFVTSPRRSKLASLNLHMTLQAARSVQVHRAVRCDALGQVVVVESFGEDRMVRGVLEKRRLAALLLVLLSGCGGDPSSTSQDAQSQAGSTAPAEVQGESGAAEAAPAEASATLSPQQQSVQLAEKAEQALREEHLFAPAGSNAFEWFLQAHRTGPRQRVRTRCLVRSDSLRCHAHRATHRRA